MMIILSKCSVFFDALKDYEHEICNFSHEIQHDQQMIMLQLYLIVTASLRRTSMMNFASLYSLYHMLLRG